MRLPATAALALLLPLLALPRAAAHGLTSWPRQRGLLGANNFGLPPINDTAPADYCPHCLNGGGTASVASHSPGGLWTPYEPTDPAFHFREDHSLCGDPLKSGAHMTGGAYVTGATIATYEQADHVDVETHVSAHHNGFFEFFLCSLDCCGTSDIEKKCFRNGCCQKLMRVPHKSCESGHDRICGPVDPAYPGRWYLPPRDEKTPEDNWYGGLNKKMRYALPENITCERCVFHWAWTTANNCNPPGYADYAFPQKWDGIPGDGGSVGGINRAFGTCGDSPVNFPEEFWSCSENIRIAPKNGGKSRTLQIFHNGEMNIESAQDSSSDMLGTPLKEPSTPSKPVADKVNNTTVTVSPTTTMPTATPTSTPTVTPTPYTASTTSSYQESTGSKYNLAAYVTSFDTGVCTKDRDDRSFCQACLNLGYGVTKCMWCHAGNDGKEVCLHDKPASS